MKIFENYFNLTLEIYSFVSDFDGYYLNEVKFNYKGVI